MKIAKMIRVKSKSIVLIALGVFLIASCKEADKPEEIKHEPFNNVLILGNSITHHAPAPEVGWSGDWGMAASAKEKDFVHLLTAKFKSENPAVIVNHKNIADFETNYWNYNLSTLDNLNALKPDLLILRIAENVDINTIEQHEFTKHYTALINYFKASNPKVKVMCVAGFWKNQTQENAIKKCSAETNSLYVELSSLDNIAYSAWDLYPNNHAIGGHPSDVGMSAIANIIWANVLKINKE